MDRIGFVQAVQRFIRNYDRVPTIAEMNTKSYRDIMFEVKSKKCPHYGQFTPSSEFLGIELKPNNNLPYNGLRLR